jgi:anaerobic magnesium-protoporphyrin IX monomethyl ester cyclase
MVRDTLPDDIGISVSYPLPGTRFHEMVKQQLGEKTNWVDSDDLAMMFEGTYASPFYRQLHRLLHQELLLRRRLANSLEGSVGAVPDLLKELDRLSDSWRELGRLEATYRSAAPTRVALPLIERPAPDLSKEWN